MAKKYFGTDGIRGRVGAHPITPEFVLKLGWAVGCYFSEHAKPGVTPSVLIGKDTRISGYMFESALEAGLVAAGVDVKLLGPMPTPGIAYLTRTFHAQAGIVISASHNPYHDNGIKFFNGEGKKLDDDIELAIECQLDNPLTTVDSNRLGKVKRIVDANGRYIEYCKSTIPSRINLSRCKVVVDCANGANYSIAPNVLRELGAEVVVIGGEPNGLNINAGIGSTSPEALREKVLEEKADVGVAFDGDGDRLIFIDRLGNEVDGDEILYIIAKDQLETFGECPGVVGTLMTNFGCELAFKELGVPFARAKVGDRYVNEMMKEKGWQLGGESSGHVICSDVSTTGDGLVAALKVLYAMSSSGQELHEMTADVKKMPQTMINVQVAQKFDVDTNEQLQGAVSSAESEMAGRGRVLLRPSGTEPVIRVMVEGENKPLVERLAQELAALVEDIAKSL